MARPRIQPRPLAVKLNNTIRMPPRAADCPDCPECEECDESGAMAVGIFWSDTAELETVFGPLSQFSFEGGNYFLPASLKTLDGEFYTGPWPNLSEWQWNITTTLFGMEEGGAVLTGAPNGYEFELEVDEGIQYGEDVQVAVFTIYAETIGNDRLSPTFTLVVHYAWYDPDA